jgi:hypothetical protein
VQTEVILREISDGHVHDINLAAEKRSSPADNCKAKNNSHSGFRVNSFVTMNHSFGPLAWKPYNETSLSFT